MARALWLAGASGLAALSLLSATTAAASTPRAPHEHPPDPASDEAGIWYASDKAEAEARLSGDLDKDPALTAYVKQVECKVAPEYCDEMRVYVLDRPFFNAMTAPNGYIEVWTGALLRARNEAELAFILGHETSHYALNHSIEAARALKSRLNAVLPIGLLAAPFVGGLVLNIGYLGAVASFEHYSREQEMEADRGGFDRMTRAGYDPSATVDIWRGLIDEQAQSAFEKVRQQHARAGLFDDHPLDGVRMEAMAALVKDHGKGDLGADRYRAAIRPHLPALLRDDLRRRDYGETLFIIDRLMAGGADAGVLGYFKGECYRLRRGDGDAAKAVAAYETASTAPDAPPELWRDLGALYQQQHAADKARAAYHAYLDRAPAASDRWLVEGALKTLDAREGT
ncbi:MAG TPA: M48 family metalloprotease [Caulobacteraceae bacterium]|nr:M48 family metalloprotease [Caulobacteraceae bacterium]